MATRPRLYCGNIPFDATEDDLRAHFKDYKVVEVKIITDRETGRPRGFAFVELSSDAEVEQAVKTLDGSDMGGRTMVVNQAREREKGSGGNRGGDGARNGGGRGRDDQRGRRGRDD